MTPIDSTNQVIIAEDLTKKFGTFTAVDHVSFDVKRGEIFGFLGANGAGKTTLCSLIPRFYDVTGGAVLLDGIDIRDVKLKDLRRQIGIVQQDVYLFAGTILENIRYGKPEATDEEVVNAAMAANAHEFIMSLPEGYHTDIGQRGVKLSGGQKQRLCIARALLKKPKILILDDSTSAVDTRTDALIRKAFREEIPNTTKIIIAQRVSSIEDADQIIVLDDGKIAGVGTSEELLKTNDIYREVYESQVKGGGDDE